MSERRTTKEKDDSTRPLGQKMKNSFSRAVMDGHRLTPSETSFYVILYSSDILFDFIKYSYDLVIHLYRD
jgi:hypothetical protein